jgi:hypothetical protein
MCSRIQGPPTWAAHGGVLSRCELEDQDEVRVVDRKDLRGCRACVEDARRTFAERLRRILRERVAQVQMVDHDRHAADPTAGQDREEASAAVDHLLA